MIENVSAKSGLTIGGKDLATSQDNLVQDTNKDDVVEGGIQKTKGINFRGSYVMVVPKEDGTTDLWFGPNNNPKPYSSIEQVSGSNLYVYASGNSTYDTTGLTSNAKHARCILTTTGQQTLDLNGGAEMNSTEVFDLVVTVNYGGKTDTITVANVGKKDASGNYSTSLSAVGADGKETKTGVQVNVTNIVVNNDTTHADAGLTPGFIRFKANVKVTYGTLLPNGGTAVITAKIGTATDDIDRVFVYKSTSLSSALAPTIETATYTAGTTKQVSGITYDSSANIACKVVGIQGTEKYCTPSLNRLKLTSSATAVKNALDEAGTAVSITTGTVVARGSLTRTSADNTANTDAAVYSWTSGDYAVTSSTPQKVSVTLTATPYEPTRTTDTPSTTVKGTKTVTSSTYLWTSAKADTTKWSSANSTILINCETDTARKIGYVEGTGQAAKLVLVSGDYDNKVSVIDETNNPNYAKQLIVQGGKIKHPAQDATGTYPSTTKGTRYCVYPINLGGSDTSVGISTLKLTVGGLANTFGSGVKIYLASSKASETTLQQLNAKKNEGLNGCATSSAPNGSGYWEVEPSGAWGVKENTTYYLIVEMTESATKIGTIKIDKKVS